MRAAALALAVALPVSAQERITWNPAVDYTVTGLAFAGFVVPELMKQSLAPASCNACNPSLNSVDAWFHDRLTGAAVSRETANTVSSVWAFALLPIGAGAAAALAAPSGERLNPVLVVAESSALSAAAVQSVKFFVARQRPFARYGHGDPSGAYSIDDRDSHLSFPSGHTAFATSLGVSAAMTAQLEHSAAAPWLWALAGAMCVSTASLRVIAEKHYFTDVAAGALIGSLSGVAVPLLHHQSRSATLAASPTTISLSGSF